MGEELGWLQRVPVKHMVVGSIPTSPAIFELVIFSETQKEIQQD